MDNLIVAIILLIVLGIAITYIIREKKKGVVCVGCSHAGTCAKRMNGMACDGHNSEMK